MGNGEQHPQAPEQQKGSLDFGSISLSAVISALPILGMLWFLGKPFLISEVSAAMSDDIKKTVQTEVAPLNTAFKAIIRKEITRLKKEIASHEFRRDNPPDDDWTEEDATRLVELQEELAAQEEALEALDGTT